MARGSIHDSHVPHMSQTSLSIHIANHLWLVSQVKAHMTLMLRLMSQTISSSHVQHFQSPQYVCLYMYPRTHIHTITHPCITLLSSSDAIHSISWHAVTFPHLLCTLHWSIHASHTVCVFEHIFHIQSCIYIYIYISWSYHISIWHISSYMYTYIYIFYTYVCMNHTLPLL